MVFSLGRTLRAKGITQKAFRDTLEKKYNHSVDITTVNGYCLKEYPSPYPCWKVIQKCLKEEYNIEHRNGRWQEVYDYE